MVTTTRFDAAEYLDTPEWQAAYINAAFETGDLAFVRDALGLTLTARPAEGKRKAKKRRAA